MMELLAVVGALSLAGTFAFCAAMAVGAQSQPPCQHLRETIDTDSCYLARRCLECGRRVELGIAWHAGSNRRSGRSP